MASALAPSNPAIAQSKGCVILACQVQDPDLAEPEVLSMAQRPQTLSVGRITGRPVQTRHGSLADGELVRLECPDGRDLGCRTIVASRMVGRGTERERERESSCLLA